MEHVSKLNIVVRDLPYTVYPIPTTLDDRQTYYMYDDAFYDKMLYNEVSKGVINLITLIDNNAHTIRTLSKDMYDDIHMEYIQRKRKSSISKELTVTSYINQFT